MVVSSVCFGDFCYTNLDTLNGGLGEGAVRVVNFQKSKEEYNFILPFVFI
jgi:hypothetical protein